MLRLCFRALDFAVIGIISASLLYSADPTFLHRYLPDIQPKSVDLTTASAQYKPVFGVGDADQRQLKGIARYGELIVAPAGASELVSYPAEEQIYYVLEGNGVLLYDGDKIPVKTNDFMYLPVGIKHGMANTSNAPVQVMVMGFKIPPGTVVPPTRKLMIANADNAKLTPVEGHGPTSLFKLLMGQTWSRRDVLPAAIEMVSLFIMDFAPGGTNIPHHHDTAEEIYYILRGHGDMVAGGGADGNEGRYPSKEGDAFFYRLNTTVGFYSGAKPGEPHDLILAVRSLYPFPKNLSKQ